MNLALFDLDKTLYNGFSMQDVMHSLHSSKEIPDEGPAWMSHHFGKYEAGEMTYDEATTIGMRKFAEMFAGLTDEVFAAHSQKLLKNNKLYAYSIDLVKRVKQRGYLPVVISTATEQIAPYLVRALGIDLVISSEVARRKDGSYSEKITHLVHGENKGKAAREMMEKYRPEHTVAFGDSTSDVPMFEEADDVYIVNSHENELRDLSQQRKWNVVVEHAELEQLFL